jgi:hypothetical protein
MDTFEQTRGQWFFFADKLAVALWQAALQDEATGEIVRCATEELSDAIDWANRLTNAGFSV